MAAAGGHIKNLHEEATCPICLDYFRDPVTIAECGHNFCRACLSQYWGESDTEVSCPQCRKRVQQRNLIANRALASVAEIAKNLSLQGLERAEGKKEACEKHQEPLKLFCKDDETPICMVCDKSKEHRDHEVVPAEEASQEYKDLIYCRLEILRKEKEKILAYQADTEKENEDLLKQTKAEREKTVAQFRQLCQFLQKQEKLLLAQMEEVEKEIIRQREEYQAKLSEELSSLESLIRKMEEKRQQPASELLQDVRSTLQRSEKETFENPVAFPLELKWRIWEFCDINAFLEGVMKQFKDTMLPGLQLQKASVTLDPDTANPSLILSEDHKGMRVGDKRQDLPNNPERFDSCHFVLGCEGFTAGRHFWEVNLGSEEIWALGVARKSVRRKGEIDIHPKKGIWTVGMWGSAFKACNHPYNHRLSLTGELKRIRVSLNYAGGRVAFYDADRGALLYTFSGASFAGETLLPFFYTWKEAHLSISP